MKSDTERHFTMKICKQRKLFGGIDPAIIYTMNCEKAPIKEICTICYSWLNVMSVEYENWRGMKSKNKEILCQRCISSFLNDSSLCGMLRIEVVLQIMRHCDRDIAGLICEDYSRVL